MKYKPLEILERSPDLATLPVIFTQINQAVEDPECSFGEIARIISADTALTARLLKIVNSSFYGFSNKIETITHAITIIGTAQLRNLVLATVIIEKFRDVPSRLLDMKSFWKHSIGVGLAARIIAIYGGFRNPDRHYILGMLHDIGRLVLFLCIPEEMKKVIEVAENDPSLVFEVECKEFGFDHAEMGEYLIQAWDLPASFKGVIHASHEPLKESKNLTEASIVNVSDAIVHALEIGSSGWKYVPPVDPGAWAEAGITSGSLPEIIHQLDRQMEDAVQTFFFGSADA